MIAWHDRVNDPLGELYVFSGWHYFWDMDSYSSVESWTPSSEPRFYIPHNLIWGDYSGDHVTRSNCRVFLREFGEIEGVMHVIGSYDSEGVVIRADCVTKEMREVFLALKDYPLIDAEDLSELEKEIQKVCWDYCIASDVRQALREHLGDNEETNSALEALGDDELFTRVVDAMYVCNEYFRYEDAKSAYLDIDKIVDKIRITA